MASPAHSKRTRVRGDHGPRRHQLPTFAKLTAVETPPEVIEEIRHLAFDDPERNDMRGPRYEISNNCPLTDMFGSQYRHVLLQDYVDGDDTDEINYTQWRDECPETRKHLEATYGTTYRARVAVTPPGSELDWHIDTDPSVICRIQLGIDVVDSTFEFNRRGNHESFTMETGEWWFINVGWKHRVVNNSDRPRVVVIAGVHYANIEGLM